MKKLVVALVLLISSFSYAANLVDNPSTSQTIIPSSAGVDPLVINLYGNPSGDHNALTAYSDSGTGGVFSSNTAQGISASSAEGIAGEFYPSVGDNTSPTVKIWSGGGTGDHLQATDIDGNVLLAIRDSGLLLMADASAESCNATNRGGMRVLRGGSGVADALQVCLKAAGGSYSWVTK